MSALKAKPKRQIFLARQRVEHGREHVQHETLLLVLVDPHDPLDVVRHLLQSLDAAQVDKVQDVLLEAGPAEADARIEELAADAAVHPHDLRYFRDIGARFLADGRDGVDRRDALGEEEIGGKLRELAAPDVRRDDPFAGNPVGVDLHQLIAGLEAPLRGARADEHAIGSDEIPDRRPLGEKLRVRQHVEVDPVVSRHEDPLHGLGRLDGEGALLDDDLGRLGVLEDLPGRKLPVLQVRRKPRAGPECLRGRVDGDEDDVVFLDAPGDVGGEKQVPSQSLSDNLIEAGLVDGRLA